MSRPLGPVAITGVGAVSAAGWGWRSLWDAVREGRDGITKVERYPLEGFSVRLGGLVPGANRPMPKEEIRSLCLKFAFHAAEEAAHEGQLWEANVPADRIGLCVGTSLGDAEEKVHKLAEDLAGQLDIHGPRLTISTACTSSANALGLATDLLRMGSADLVLAGGADLLSETVFAGFHALGVLSVDKCAPFGLPFGTTLGEGAGFLLLETAEHALARGQEAFAYLAGYGLSGDGYHETSPDPKGRGLGRAMVSAMAAAGFGPEEVGYVNAHGSGTEANDRAEWLAIQGVFEEGAKSLPVSSTKGHLGHAQGAAGVLEGIVTLLSLRDSVVPPTLHCRARRSFGPEDPVAEPHPRPARYQHSLCSSSAFGGANCVVAFSREASPGAAKDRGISVPLAMGLGAVGPFASLSESVDGWLLGEKTPLGPVSVLNLRDVAPMANPREMDNLGQYLTTASALALRDAGIKVRGPLRDRAGLVVGATTISVEEGRAFQRSVDERGLVRCSATSFSKMVLNSAAGTCSKVLTLRGPTSTVTTGIGSGLMAIIYACEILASRTDVDLMVAAGVDAQNIDGQFHEGRSDGAACLVVGRENQTTGPGKAPRISVAGWGIAGPRHQAAAIEAALGPSGLSLSAIDLIVGEPMGLPIPGTFHSAFGSAWAAIGAAHALRVGRARTAVVLSAQGESASGALFLTRTERENGR